MERARVYKKFAAVDSDFRSWQHEKCFARKEEKCCEYYLGFLYCEYFFLLNVVFAVSCIGKLGFNFTWFIHLPGCLLYSLVFVQYFWGNDTTDVAQACTACI